MKKILNKTLLQAQGKKKGFTLVELLVVISIMSILTIISVSSFRSAQIKAKDAQRKSDLYQVSKALMLYYSDNGVFPDLTSAQLFGNEAGFTGSNEVIYMRKTPQETKSGWLTYIYLKDQTRKSFNLFADLENKKDSQCKSPAYSNGYCYGLASPNTIVDPNQF